MEQIIKELESLKYEMEQLKKTIRDCKYCWGDK